MTSFVLQFPSFRYHGNKGGLGKFQLAYIVKLHDFENQIWGTIPVYLLYKPSYS